MIGQSWRVSIRLTGPHRLVLTATSSGLSKETDAALWITTSHLIAVSTAYVAGTRKGDAREELLGEGPYAVAIDWQNEIETARRARIRSEDESRTAASLTKFAKEAKEELGAAGGNALANKTERLVAEDRTFSFVLHDGQQRIVVTQNDVRQIQLAKAALYAGVSCCWTVQA